MLLRLCQILCMSFCCATISLAACQPGDAQADVFVQVLGSGGPELNDQRAASSYLIWHKGKAKLLIDIGSGSLLNLEKTNANINDIDAILLTHLHVDHTADLPTFVKASFFSDRRNDLSIWGPSGNDLMPSTTAFITSLFGKQGAFRYLNSYLAGTDTYQIKPYNIRIGTQQTVQAFTQNDYQMSAVAVHHGPIPAIAWQVIIAGKKLVFSGDMNNDNRTLTHLAHNADLLIVHHAIPEHATGIARQLHMPPSVIGAIAKQANVKQLVLSHHMSRTLHQFDQSKAIIKQTYTGPLAFAEDLACVTP